jgi:hypothetical protein
LGYTPALDDAHRFDVTIGGAPPLMSVRVRTRPPAVRV